MAISITETAAPKIKDIMKAEDIENQFLRLKVIGQGCAGFSYDLYFEDQPSEFDDLFEDREIKVIVDQLSLQYVDGATIDVVENTFGISFKVINPMAKTTCGCGNSFNVS